MTDDELPRSMAARQLDLTIGRQKEDPVISSLASLIQIDREALALRRDISKCHIGISGIRAWRRLSELEERYLELYEELLQAQEAVIEHKPYDMPRVDQSFGADSSNLFLDKRNKMGSQINETIDELDRTFSALTAKQSAATSRTGILLSVSAVLVSAMSIAIQPFL